MGRLLVTNPAVAQPACNIEASPMGGRGFPPKDPSQRRTRHVPRRGDWQNAPGERWRFGPIPKAPEGLGVRTRAAWRRWFTSWPAAFWTPDDLPQLEIMALLHDAVARGVLVRAGELRLWLNSYGLTISGQVDRRWLAPSDAPVIAEREPSPYRHLHAVKDGESA